MPKTYGYLLYNRNDEEIPRSSIAPDVLRNVLDTQVQFKQLAENKEKEKDRVAVEAQVCMYVYMYRCVY